MAASNGVKSAGFARVIVLSDWRRRVPSRSQRRVCITVGDRWKSSIVSSVLG